MVNLLNIKPQFHFISRAVECDASVQRPTCEQVAEHDGICVGVPVCAGAAAESLVSSGSAGAAGGSDRGESV